MIPHQVDCNGSLPVASAKKWTGKYIDVLQCALFTVLILTWTSTMFVFLLKQWLTECETPCPWSHPFGAN